MEGLRQMNDWLEEKYGLTESSEDKAKFIDYVGQERFDRFEKLKNSGRIKGNESDYYYWIKKPLDEFDSFLSGLEAATSNSASRKAAKKEGAELVYEDDQWKVYRIETYEAAIQYGKGTKWCISGLFPEKPGAGKEHFDHYKTCGVEAFYFFIPKHDGGQKWCYADYGEDGADNYTNILWDSKSNGYTIRELYMAPDGAPSDPLLILFGIDPDRFLYDIDEDDTDEMDEALDRKHSLKESNADKNAFAEYAGIYNSNRFNKLKSEGRLTGAKSDYYYWINKHSVEELSDFLDRMQAVGSKTSVKKETKRDGAELVYRGNGWSIFRITTLLAAVLYGEDTKWCISGRDEYNDGENAMSSFEQYKDEGVENYYFLIPDNDPYGKWCFLDYGVDYNEDKDYAFWDSQDHGYDLQCNKSGRKDPIETSIPAEVLQYLPGFKEYKEKRQQIADGTFVPQYDESLDRKHSLTEAKEDKERFAAFAGEELAARFNELKFCGKIRGAAADYGYWEKRTVEELQQFVDSIECTPTTSEERRLAKAGATKVYEGNGWTVYKINTYDAAKYYGKGTKWCITGCYGTDGHGMFEQYKNEGVKDYYFIIPEDYRKGKWCYLDWEDINDEDLRQKYDYAVPVFFNAADYSYPESKVSAVLSLFPRSVANCLPDLDMLNTCERGGNTEDDDEHMIHPDDVSLQVAGDSAIIMAHFGVKVFNPDDPTCTALPERRIHPNATYAIHQSDWEAFGDSQDGINYFFTLANAAKGTINYLKDNCDEESVRTAIQTLQDSADDDMERIQGGIPIASDPYAAYSFARLYALAIQDGVRQSSLNSIISGIIDRIPDEMVREAAKHGRGGHIHESYTLKEAKEDTKRFVAFAGQNLATRFDALKHGGRITGDEADYGYWEKKPVDELRDFIKGLESRKSKTQQKKETAEAAKASGADTVYEGHGWKILKIKNFDAAAYYGKGTKWCICGTKPNKDGVEEGRQEFDDYKAQGVKDFYFLIGPRDEKWCYTDFGSRNMMETQETFFDASNQVYYFGDLDYISSKVPPEVLRHLPWLSGGIDYALRMIDNVKGKVDQDGTYYYDGRDSMQTLVLLRGKVKKLIVGRDARSIQPQAFMGYSFLESVEFEPDSHLTSIGFASFAACVKLKSIVIPKSVTSIEQYAFRFCFELASVKFESGSRLTNVGSGAFEDCKKLANGVKLPDGSTCRVHITDLHERTD